MKYLTFTTFLLITLSVTMGCSNKKAEPVMEEKMPTITNTQPQDTSSVASTTGDEASQHFVCPNKCKGSGGPAEGTCPVCGTAYVHNEAYHKGQAAPEPAMKIDPVTHMAVPTHTEAKNANGVYHFVCPNGDPGGAGVAGKCAKCGAELVHNQAFHSN